MAENVDALKAEIASWRARATGLRNIITNQEQQIHALQQKIDQLEKLIEQLKARLHEIQY